jgi:hypothetical protein
MKLTLEEAIALRDFLEQLCVSYYEIELRSALKGTIKYLNELIEELNIYIEEEVIEPEEAIALLNDGFIESEEE